MPNKYVCHIIQLRARIPDKQSILHTPKSVFESFSFSFCSCVHPSAPFSCSCHAGTLLQACSWMLPVCKMLFVFLLLISFPELVAKSRLCVCVCVCLFNCEQSLRIFRCRIGMWVTIISSVVGKQTVKLDVSIKSELGLKSVNRVSVTVTDIPCML